MNIEELKLVSETIRSLSGDASAVAYWYFGMEFAKWVIGWVLGVGLLVWFAHKICQAAGVGADEEFMSECRDALRIGSHGILTAEERRATQAAIRKLIQERKQ